MTTTLHGVTLLGHAHRAALCASLIGAAAARLVTMFGAKLRATEAIARAEALLAHLGMRLTGYDWLAAGDPEAADVAIYGYAACAPEGNVYLAPFPSVRRWLDRGEALPSFLPMPRTRAGLEKMEDAR